MKRGPKPSSASNLKARAQRRRRATQLARKNVCSTMADLIRIGVLPITATVQATDIARLRWTNAALQEKGYDITTRALLLVFDWAARAPAHTAIFLTNLPPATAEIQVDTLVNMFRSPHMNSPVKSFWKGPTGLNLTKFLIDADVGAVWGAAVMMTSGSRVRCTRLVADLTGFKFLSSYCAYALVRAVSVAIGIKIRDTEGPAHSMSLNTSLLAAVLPVASGRRHLRPLCAAQPDAGFVAWAYCETMKILRHEAILEPLAAYSGNQPFFVDALASERACRLAARLASMTSAPHPCNAESQALSDMMAHENSMEHTSTDCLSRWKQHPQNSVQRDSARKRPAASARRP